MIFPSGCAKTDYRSGVARSTISFNRIHPEPMARPNPIADGPKAYRNAREDSRIAGASALGPNLGLSLPMYKQARKSAKDSIGPTLVSLP